MLCVEMLYSMAKNAGMEGIPVRKLICDKCKKEIDVSFMDKYDMHPKASCRIFGDKGSKILSDSADLEYDLCEDCANQLVTFLKG